MPKLRLPRLGRAPGRHTTAAKKTAPRAPQSAGGGTWYPTPAQWERLQAGQSVKGVKLATDDPQFRKAGPSPQLRRQNRGGSTPARHGAPTNARQQLEQRQGRNVYQSPAERYRGQRDRNQWPGQTGGREYPSIHPKGRGRAHRQAAPVPRRSDQDEMPRTGMWRR